MFMREKTINAKEQLNKKQTHKLSGTKNKSKIEKLSQTKIN
jgi:hypothetical protein